MSPASEPLGDLAIGEPAGPMWLFGSEGQQFRLPVTVTVAFDSHLLDDYETPDDVLVYTSPKANPAFSVMATALVDGSHVSVETTHFSLFGARHHTRMFGLGVDAVSSAIASTALYAELKSDWKSSQGHSLQSARRVFGIDGTDGNPDNANVKLLVESNQESASAWASAAKNGLAGLTTWVDGVKNAGLMPIVAIAVSRFDKCLEKNITENWKSCPKGEKQAWTSIDHDRFKDRFLWLLENYPDVRAWGFINEPDAAGFAAEDAVDYYVDGATVLEKRQHDKESKGVSLFAGEFAFVDSVQESTKYWNSFGAKLIESVKANKLGFPRFWGMHPYKDTTGTKTKSGVRFDTDGTSAYLEFLARLEKQANLKEDTLRAWLTETGTMLEWNVGVCADSRDNEAQFGGAHQIYTLAAMSRVDRVYWWQFEQVTCDWGGAWDSSMVDWNGLPRPAFYALTKKADAYPGVSVSRDCGGPGKNVAPTKTQAGKNNCGGVFAGGSWSGSGTWTGPDEGDSQCCVLCSKQSQTLSAYSPSSGLTNTCAGAALAFCAAADRGSVQNAMPGFCSPVPAASLPPSCGALASGQSIVDAGEVRSCNGTYWLTLGTDGKLIETQLDVGQIWNVSGTSGDQLVMQADGNLVLTSSSGSTLWASGTSGNPGVYLDVQDDGSLVITGGTTPVCSLRGADGAIPACP
jgi:hypothetical protein